MARGAGNEDSGVAAEARTLPACTATAAIINQNERRNIAVVQSKITSISAAEVQGWSLISESALSLINRHCFGSNVTVFFSLPEANVPFFTGWPKSFPSWLT